MVRMSRVGIESRHNAMAGARLGRSRRSLSRTGSSCSAFGGVHQSGSLNGVGFRHEFV